MTEQLRKWAGDPDGEERWTLEVGHDRFADDEPYVVDLWVNFDLKLQAPDGWSDGGAFLTPQQARELATALRAEADACERSQRHLDELGPA